MVKIKKNSMNQCGREGKETHTPVLQCQLQPLRQSLNTVILRNPDVCVYFLVVSFLGIWFIKLITTCKMIRVNRYLLQHYS